MDIFLKASMIALFLLLGCGQSIHGTANIGETINEYLGITPYLTETEYDIGTAITFNILRKKKI